MQYTHDNSFYLLPYHACFMQLTFSLPIAKHRQTFRQHPKQPSHHQKLTSTQRQAAIMITDVMKTTATDVLDIMANLIPFHLLVDKHCYQVVICLATLPISHLLNRPVTNVACRLMKCHPTPLHNLMHRYKIHLQKVEIIKAA
jgi:hypothetical protein